MKKPRALKNAPHGKKSVILRLQHLYSARGNKRASTSMEKSKKARLKKDAAHLPHVYIQFFCLCERVGGGGRAAKENLGGICNE